MGGRKRGMDEREKEGGRERGIDGREKERYGWEREREEWETIGDERGYSI